MMNITKISYVKNEEKIYDYNQKTEAQSSTDYTSKYGLSSARSGLRKRKKKIIHLAGADKGVEIVWTSHIRVVFVLCLLLRLITELVFFYFLYLVQSYQTKKSAVSFSRLGNFFNSALLSFKFKPRLGKGPIFFPLRVGKTWVLNPSQKFPGRVAPSLAEPWTRPSGSNCL